MAKNMVYWALVASFLQAGCWSMTYRSDREVGDKFVEDTRAYYFLGMVGDEDINVYEYCRAGASKVRSYQSPVDTLLSVFTLGVYMRRTFEITCADPQLAYSFSGLGAEQDE